jgi:hypothetical protein
MSFIWERDEQTGVHPFNGILFSIEGKKPLMQR